MSVNSILLAAILFAAPAFSQTYPWLRHYDVRQSIANRISVPNGFKRTGTTPGSFQHWLTHLPLKNGNPPVYLYDGSKKGDQKAHFAVIDIELSNKDLQQCADAVIRLRAEYLYSQGRYGAIRFDFTSGDTAYFTKWIDGYRPSVNNNHVRWNLLGGKDSSYNNFRKYLETVFLYAGSYSLNQEMQTVADLHDMEIGDVFIQGGFPGHAVILVDMAVHEKTGKKLFLLAQSYMPAQDIHVLKNPMNESLSPWYDVDFGETLRTPEWTFTRHNLKRF